MLNGYLDTAAAAGILVFLDIQARHSDVPSEIDRILPYLQRDYVHVALDPEFAIAPGEIPGQAIGSLDAAQINQSQALLQQVAEEYGTPNKILIVHQFLEDMITNKNASDDYDRVDLVIDTDGFGPSHVKKTKYGWFIAADQAEYGGLKLFYQYDIDLMLPEDVLSLTPIPDVIIYQ